MICLYCGEDKPEGDFSDEHIIPRALLCGGLTPTNPFKTKLVCRTCNSRCGRYIDRPFIKNWFTQNQRATNSLKYIDLSLDPAIPLTYMGALKTSPIPDKVCDNWLGPTGDLIFHFHDPYPSPVEPGIPPPSLTQSFDPGFALIWIRASNPVWHKCILKSIAENFEEAELYLINTSPIPLPFKKLPDGLESLKESLQSSIAEKNEVKFSFDITCGDRFISKLALGFGGMLLSPEFTVSEDARRLRQFLWETDSDERAKINIHGARFGELNKDFAAYKYFAWPPGHSIYLRDLGNRLVFIMIFYGEQAAMIERATDRNLWLGRIEDSGRLYLIAPGLKSWKEASSGKFLAARQNLLSATDELALFLKKAENPLPLPPYML